MPKEESLLESAKGVASSMIEKAQSAIDGNQSWWEKTKDWFATTYDKAKEYTGKAVDAVKDTAKAADNATGGWLGDNKWLLTIGVGGALLAVFGMEGGSGFFQTLSMAVLAIGALALGSYMDSDNKQSFFGKYFKSDPQPDAPGKERKLEPAPDKPTTLGENPQVSKGVATLSYKTKSRYRADVGSNPAYIDENGNGIDQSPKGIPNVMHIKYDKDGNVTHMSVSKDGIFPDKEDKKTMKEISGIQFEVKEGHIDLTSKANEPKVKELRKIADVLLVSSLEQKYDVRDAALGDIKPYLSASAKKDSQTTTPTFT